MANGDVTIEHPNREKPASKTTKAVVVFLMLVSAVLVMIVTIGGWDALQGGQMIQIVYVLIYLVIAFYITRWRSGMLPVAAALAIILAIFAGVAVPGWFARDKNGFESPAMDENMLGVITIMIIPVQALLIGFAMHGFGQKWSVEVERHPDGTTRAAA